MVITMVFMCTNFQSISKLLKFSKLFKSVNYYFFIFYNHYNLIYFKH